MSDEKPEPYTPPDSTRTLKQILEEPVSRIVPVDCTNCPVSMLCQESTGGTGFSCETCGSTSVYLDEPDEMGLVTEILMVDCNKHLFPRNKDRTRQCGLCDGQVMSFYASNFGATHHYLPTVHAAVPLKKRKEVLVKAYKLWRAKIKAQEAAKKEREQAAKALRDARAAEDKANVAAAAAAATSPERPHAP